MVNHRSNPPDEPARLAGERATFIALWLCLAAFGSLGCEAPGVGDPCEPEQIPEDGFKNTEVYLETRSLQCRTRVCLVNKLTGDPSVRVSCNEAGADTTCVVPCPSGDETCSGCKIRKCDLYVSPEAVEERVYCTCKCDGQDQDTIRCDECPDGFECCPAFTIGPPGLRGSYCVRNDTCAASEEGE